MSKETFPGVYTTITDESIQPTLASRFRAGIIGIASKGPMNTPTSVPTIKSQQRIFGLPVEDHEMGPIAVAVASEYSDGTVFTRVGKQYTPVATDGSSTLTGSGPSTPDQWHIYTDLAKNFSIGDYIRVVQAGKPSTVNARIEDYVPAGDQLNATGLALVSVGAEAVPLAVDLTADPSGYTEAYIDKSSLPNSASNAEAFLDAVVYKSANYSESAGFVTGDKSSFEFTTTGIVGPQPVTTLVFSGGTGTATIGALANKFKVGDVLHLDNVGGNWAGANGEVTVTAVVADTSVDFEVTAEYGPDIDTGTPSSGYVQINVTPGSQYKWTKGVNETSLVNGGSTITATGTFIAEGSFVRIYCTAADGQLTIVQGVPDGTASIAPGAASITLAILAPGDIIKISQASRNTTWEAMVKEITGGNQVSLYPSKVNESGYQPVPLQDNYSAGLIQKADKNSDGTIKTEVAIHLIAATAGTWANSDGSTTGLWIKVSPGSAPGSKKFLIYERGSLVETIDNLSLDPESDDYYVTRINGISENISILTSTTDEENEAAGMILADVPPANTLMGWNSQLQRINHATFGSGSNGKGFNGELAEFDDYVGSYDETTDRYTGLRAFLEEGSNLNLSVILAPGVTDFAVQQELMSVGANILAQAILDHPKGINGRRIVDWSNGAGEYSNERSILDSWHGALIWNWFTISNPYTGETIWVPPSIGLLRQMAYTADNFKPWYAASGETRGVITIAKKVEFPHVSKDTRSAMYGGGQAVNPILFDYGKIMVYGNRTLQRVESKLSDLSVAMLVKYVVKNMSIIGRKYVFDPNDPELLMLLKMDFTSFLEGVKSDRGLEDYNLKIDSENNTAEVRNQRAAIVDFNMIPYGAMERLYINAIVNKSGATINNIQ